MFHALRPQNEIIRTDYNKLLELVRESGMDYKWSIK